MLSASSTGKHDGGDIVRLQIVSNETAHDMTSSQRDRRVHRLIIENEHIHASVDLDRVVRRNGIDSRERRVGHGRIALY